MNPSVDYACGTSLKNLRKRYILCFLIPIYVYNHLDHKAHCEFTIFLSMFITIQTSKRHFLYYMESSMFSTKTSSIFIRLSVHNYSSPPPPKLTTDLAIEKHAPGNLYT
uniref:Uncharacterized protein n=1 Tax=Lactuca sativa TaxID=4236 RepID=A0A9R1V5M7_LACSA|nr:hypothetical protein LSAT_V11C600325830 [Lactuca sativa]